MNLQASPTLPDPDRPLLVAFPRRDLLDQLVVALHLQPVCCLLFDYGPGHGARRLQEMLTHHGLACQVETLPDFQDCADHVQHLLNALSACQEQLALPCPTVLNVGLAADAWEMQCQQLLRNLFSKEEFAVVAFEASNSTLHHLEPGPVSTQQVPAILEPADYLMARGATLRQALTDSETHRQAIIGRRSLSLQLARQCAKIGKNISVLNAVCAAALSGDEQVLAAPAQTFYYSPSGAFREALLAMQQAGLLMFDGKRELVFSSLDACRYLKGGWLEEYAWLTAIEAGAVQVHGGLELTWNTGSGKSPRNELDLFLLHNNRALTVECKTLFMGEGDETAKILYKLDSIADRLGEAPGNAVLLSALPVRELIGKRAIAQGIEVFDAGGLYDFRPWLRGWLVG